MLYAVWALLSISVNSIHTRSALQTGVLRWKWTALSAMVLLIGTWKLYCSKCGAVKGGSVTWPGSGL